MKINLVAWLFFMIIAFTSEVVCAQAMVEGNAVSTVKSNAVDAQVITTLTQDANRGDAQAQTKLGKMYFLGKGVPKDYDEALIWLRLAAEQGNAHAQFFIGYMYFRGTGVTENFQEAVRWYRLAADQGELNAQRNLAGMYILGNGVSRDDSEGAKWFRLAADHGDSISQRQLGLMYAIGKGVPQDDKEAEKWLHLAADQGDPVAKSKLPFISINQAESDAMDAGYEKHPPQDATSANNAVTLMMLALHNADYIRAQCIKFDPVLQPEIDTNLSQWKKTEAHAANMAVAQWATLIEKQPDIAHTLDLGDGFLQMTVERMASIANGKGLQLYCKKYFGDLASGIWRKRTPEVYAYLDRMP